MQIALQRYLIKVGFGRDIVCQSFSSRTYHYVSSENKRFPEFNTPGNNGILHLSHRLLNVFKDIWHCACEVKFWHKRVESLKIRNIDLSLQLALLPIQSAVY